MLFEDLLKKLARSLDEEGIEYLVMGGQAVLVHGEPRLTRDVDITLGVTPDNLNRILKIAENLGLKVLVSDPEKFINETWVLPAQDLESGIRVDFIFSASEFEKQALQRAQSIDIEGTPVRFASAEDLIIQKIFSGRPRDIEDVRGILIKKIHQLDINYIQGTLKKFDEALSTGSFSQRFEALLKEQRELTVDTDQHG